MKSDPLKLSLGTVSVGRIIRLGVKNGNFRYIEVPGTSLSGWLADKVAAKRANGYFVAHVRPKEAVVVEIPPTLNGHPISAQSTPLNDHDVIEIAGMKLEFVIKT